MAVSNVVTGLTSGTTYHFRAIAANAVGTSTGADLTFTTLTVTQPQVKPVLTLGNNQFGFNFTNAPGAIFTVLVTTNLALDINSWTVLGMMTELPPGTYSFSNALESGGHFYRIRSP